MNRQRFDWRSIPRRIILQRSVLAVWSIALALTGQCLALDCAHAAGVQDAAQATVIRYLAGYGNVTTYELADALGWLRGTGIRLQSVGYSQGGPESLAAMASGSADLAGAATPAIINAIVGGAKILGVMPDGGIDKTINSKFFVLAASDIKTARDLKDKSIAVNTLGAHLDYTVREYLRSHGLAADDVKLITVPGPQLDQILRHNEADVVAVGAWQSIFAGKIEAEGGVRVLFTDYDVLGPTVLGTIAMEKAFIATHARAVKDFVTASAKAADWSADHPDEAKRLVAKILAARGENADLAKFWPGFGLREHALYTDRDAQFWIDVLTRSGRLKPGQFTPEDIETNRYNGLGTLAGP
ncbi:MAG TPA: ABC transporter substrate-binding protein [Stellaceae bacterium]|nr:ABC transporter substrate-binding protein [Stellaceae bacterium]